MPNMSFAEILDKFSLACICDKNINALKYFDCKQKVSGTQLDLLEDESNKDKILIYSSFDQKKYKLTKRILITFLIMKQKIIFLVYQLIIT
tara:strand:+ start:283 stop:555 length:273 start_codon:yes stop_codon:yes gene_type:complete